MSEDELHVRHSLRWPSRTGLRYEQLEDLTRRLFVDVSWKMVAVLPQTVSKTIGKHRNLRAHIILHRNGCCHDFERGRGIGANVHGQNEAFPGTGALPAEAVRLPAVLLARCVGAATSPMRGIGLVSVDGTSTEECAIRNAHVEIATVMSVNDSESQNVAPEGNSWHPVQLPPALTALMALHRVTVVQHGHNS